MKGCWGTLGGTATLGRCCSVGGYFLVPFPMPSIALCILLRVGCLWSNLFQMKISFCLCLAKNLFPSSASHCTGNPVSRSSLLNRLLFTLEAFTSSALPPHWPLLLIEHITLPSVLEPLLFPLPQYLYTYFLHSWYSHAGFHEKAIFLDRPLLSTLPI